MIQFLPADLSRESDDLRGHLPIEILADGRHFHDHAGEFEGMGLHDGEFFHADVLLENEGHQRFDLARKRIEGGRRQGSLGVKGSDLFDGRIDVSRPVGDEDKVEGGLIVNEDLSSGIQNQTSHRLDLPQADAVVFGALTQLVPLDDLQIP